MIASIETGPLSMHRKTVRSVSERSSGSDIGFSPALPVRRVSQGKRQFLDNVFGALHQLCPLADQGMGSAGTHRGDIARDGEYLPVLFERKFGGDKRAAVGRRLRDNHAQRNPADDPVSLREIGHLGLGPEGKFADHRPVLDDLGNNGRFSDG